MQKVLLVMDSYGELVQLEQILKKLSFDTLGVQTSLSLQDHLLGFSPEVVVMSARGAKVNGVELSQRIKKRKGLPKIILLFPHGYEPKPSELASAQMDAVFESPVDPVRFLTGLCKLIGLDAAVVIDKFTRLQGFGHNGEYGTYVNHRSDGGPTSYNVSGKTGPNESEVTNLRSWGVSDAPANGNDKFHLAKGKHQPATKDRSETYREIAAQITLPGSGGLSADRIQSFLKERRRSPQYQAVDEELDASRREFVRALFSRS